MLAKARAELKANRFHAAEELCKEAIALYDRLNMSGLGHYWLGEVYLKQGLADEAYAELRQTYRAGLSDRIELAFALAAARSGHRQWAGGAYDIVVKQRKGVFANRIPDFELLPATTDSKDIELGALLLRAALPDADPDEALHELAQASNISKSNPLVPYLKGLSFLAKKDYGRARELLTQATKCGRSKVEGAASAKLRELDRIRMRGAR
jgi:tetratricopeptide (TPR) repeat protein